jgi:hypothetical protein
MDSHRDSSSVVDLNAPLLSAHRQHDQHDLDHSRRHDEDVDDTDLDLENSSETITGFQPPDRKELTTMIISGTVVVLLSVAAGLTTVFDWVL